MPFPNDRGDVAHGVGGGYASLNNRAFARGAVGGWYGREIIFANGDDPFEIDWTLSAYDPVTGSIRRLVGQTGANHMFADDGVWAGWWGKPDGRRGMYTSTGLHLPEAGLLAVGPDGAIGYKPNYQSGGPVVVQEEDGTEWTLTPNHAYALQLLGNGRALWFDSVWGLQVRGLPTPQILPGGFWAPQAAWLHGAWWMSYFSGTAGVVVHPFTSFDGFTIVPPGFNAWHAIRALDDQTLLVTWSTGPAEHPGEIFTTYVDVVEDVEYEPRSGTVLNRGRVSLLPPVVIPAIGRPIWFGWFVGSPGQGGGWATPTNPRSLPGNCYLSTLDGFVYTKGGVQFAQYVAAEAAGQRIEAEITKARQRSTLPVIPYWTAKDHLGPVPSGDWVGIECYRRRDETVEGFELRLRVAIRRCRQVCLIPQCYTSNTDNTTDLASIPAVIARLARDFPQVVAVIVFSGTGRGSGLQDHPDVLPLWQQVAVEEGLMLKKPEVTVEKYERLSQPGGQAVFIDRENPGLGLRVRVWNENGSIYMEVQHTGGSGRTGAARPV